MLYSALHFNIISVSNSESLILARCARIIKPLAEKTLSTGADVAGVQKTLANSGRSRLNCWHARSSIISDEQNSGELISCR
jgi:hypothetical protein